jgi:hydrogenase maturation protease
MGMNESVLLIGVGNEFRSDDGVGILAAREIRRRAIPGVTVLEENGEGTALMRAWEKYDSVIIVDAFSSGAPSGEIHRMDAATDVVPAHYIHASSHAFGVVQAVEMARILHSLPHVLLVYGVEGKQFDVGPGLTDPVLRSMPDLLTSIEMELKRLGAHGPVTNGSAGPVVM